MPEPTRERTRRKSAWAMTDACDKTQSLKVRKDQRKKFLSSVSSTDPSSTAPYFVAERKQVAITSPIFMVILTIGSPLLFECIDHRVIYTALLLPQHFDHDSSSGTSAVEATAVLGSDDRVGEYFPVYIVRIIRQVGRSCYASYPHGSRTKW